MSGGRERVQMWANRLGVRETYPAFVLRDAGLELTFASGLAWVNGPVKKARLWFADGEEIVLSGEGQAPWKWLSTGVLDNAFKIVDLARTFVGGPPRT